MDGRCTKACSVTNQATECAGLSSPAACVPEPLLYGYVGGDFDEVKFIKESLP
jgi:hypothetical protein